MQYYGEQWEVEGRAPVGEGALAQRVSADAWNVRHEGEEQDLGGQMGLGGCIAALQGPRTYPADRQCHYM